MLRAVKTGLKHVTRVGKRNQVTIPARFLKDLGLAPGQAVEVAESEGEIQIRKAEDAWSRFIGFLHRPGIAPLSDEELVRIIHQSRKEHAEEAAAADARTMANLKDD
jgi:AbrB family looped-hinge helix DNA binding protein